MAPLCDVITTDWMSAKQLESLEDSPRLKKKKRLIPHSDDGILCQMFYDPSMLN